MIPIIFSAGGALRACDNDLLPEPEVRNGRHWMRVKLGMILMKFAFEISPFSTGLRCRRRLVFGFVYVVNTPVLSRAAVQAAVRECRYISGGAGVCWW